MKRKINEKGAVTIVEATFVFPIMFFVLFFLLFYGNSVYVKSHIDSIVTRYAIEAAAEISDPLLEGVKANRGTVGGTADAKPYRYLLSGYANSIVAKYKNLIIKEAKFGGFFGSMTPKAVTCKAKYNNYILYQSVRYDVEYNIQIPIRMIFSNYITVMKFISSDEEPVSDASELVLNTNMVVDYAERLGIDKKINELKSKIKKFL